MKRRHPPNLLVVGASGNVARAVLRRLGGLRSHFGRLVLLDKNHRVLQDPYLEHHRLDYRFIRHRLRLPDDGRFFRRLLRQHRIDVVLDVSNHDTLPLLAATDAAGVSYVNTSLNDAKLEVTELVQALHSTRRQRRQAAHILCAGMNPGAVNLWVSYGLEHFGVPREIVHFEYDTSMTVDGWRPVVTWSKHEFLMETTWNRTGLFRGKDVELKPTNALRNRLPLRPWLQPIVRLKRYPLGFLVLHEENLTIGRTVGVSSRFLYAIHPKTMQYLVKTYREKGTVREGDLALGDNTTRRLNGEDLVGVCLQYPHRRVYFVNRLSNRSVIGTNATCAQVAVGIYSALFTLLYDRLPSRIHFVGDLYNSLYKHFVLSNMRVEMFVCHRHKGRWVCRDHVADIRVRKTQRRIPLVI